MGSKLIVNSTMAANYFLLVYRIVIRIYYTESGYKKNFIALH